MGYTPPTPSSIFWWGAGVPSLGASFLDCDTIKWGAWGPQEVHSEFSGRETECGASSIDPERQGTHFPFLYLPLASSLHQPWPHQIFQKKSKVYLLRAQEEWTKDIQPFPRGTGGLLLANCSRNAAQPSKCLQPGPALSLVFQKSVIAVNYFTRQINLWMKYYPPPFPMKTF